MITKPDTQTAMRKLIENIRTAIPFDTPADKLCDGPCSGCSKKLLDYLDMKLEEKEAEIDAGHIPGLGELSRLRKSAVRIHAIFVKNELIAVSDITPSTSQDQM